MTEDGSKQHGRNGTGEKLTHFDENGNAIMVDVSDKAVTQREAVAEGYITVSEECYERIMEGSVQKGDVLAVAQVAGIMGAKKTAELIPLCHILNLTHVSVRLEAERKGTVCRVHAVCTVRCSGKTGVEMEALTGVSTALLTVYDMCKAIDKKMEIGQIRLLEKSGGRSGDVHNVFDKAQSFRQ